jgi:DNA topoisomerase-1
MPRLRTVSPREPGWRRVHHGRGHRYLDVDGSPLDKEDVERVKALVIPPAWRDVWICPHPNAHLQAVGTDDAGRRQYLYHPYWRQKRDEAKFDRVIEMAGRLPRVRRRLVRELDLEKDGGLDRGTALATAVRLVDLGLFRLGSDTYTTQNGSYGLTTLERRHVSRDGDARVFCFVGKAGVEHEIRLTDPQVVPWIDRMTMRRPADARVLSAREGGRWVPLTATDINEYIRELFGMEVSAKDFRTWHATVHVARWVASAEPVRSKRARAKVVREAVVGASELLGNTPTVCRSSYVDPRVIDLYESDTTIPVEVARLDHQSDRARNRVDEAVVELLTG